MIVKFDDSTIAQIVRLVQLGILTGTDVTDQIRTLELEVKDARIFPSPDFLETFEKNLSALQDSAAKIEAKN